jgi:hypothetical protein
MKKDPVMNIFSKALITTLLIGSSTAMAKPVLTVSGHASVSLGYSTPPTRVVVRDHRHPAPVDPCATPAPAPIYTTPVYYRPVVTQPVWHEPFFNPTNTKIGVDSSTYVGSIGQAPAARWNGRGWIRMQTWTNLTEATRIDSGREFIKIGAQAGQFSKIQIKNLGGATTVTQIGIEMFNADGSKQMQVVKFGSHLSRTNPTLTVDLDGNYRSINRIIVYGTSGRGSAYQILAM